MHRTLIAAAALALALPFAASANDPLETAGSAPGFRLFVADGDQPAHGATAQGTMAQDAMMGASTYRLGDLTIESPWARASVGGAGAGGAFMTIRNAGAHGDRLIAVESDVAGRVQLHRTLMEDGVMKMRHAEDGIEVPAGGMAELKPGGFHVMLMGLKGPLEEGGQFPVTLVFERAGTVTVEVSIQAAGAMGAGMSHGH